MSEAKSSTKEAILNILTVGVACAVVGWRVHSCRKEEAAQKARVEADKVAVDSKAKARVDKCLATLPEASRGPCFQCACEHCADDFVACERDPQCRNLPPNLTLDGGVLGASTAEAMSYARTRCMVAQCRAQCFGGR